MSTSKTSPKIILSGGGTGGHIYPAIAIANEIKSRFPKAEILFVGAKDKMEMEKVPKAGYPIKGLWISGLQRSNWKANFKFPFKLLISISDSKKILNEFMPDIAIGTGGFASGPLLWAASKRNIPILIQEQNSFPGITNKLLKNKAFAICTAYDGMETFFPANKTVQTGNPIRAELFTNLVDSKVAKTHFGLNPEKPVILSVGGSLGSRTLNNAWEKGIEELVKNDVQLLWQTGKTDWKKLSENSKLSNPLIHLTEFIYEMNIAYAAADVIVSRAGAMAISELALVAKPTILVPFPFAAEDHQTKNAESLTKHHAAIMIKDKDAAENLVKESIALVQNLDLRQNLAKQLKNLAKPNATQDIVDLVEKKLNEV